MARLIYTGDRLREIAFPIGGIGTGTISLGGRGQLLDFEIANRPAKGGPALRNFFALGINNGTGLMQARVLERQLLPPFTGPHGVPSHLVPGLPRFRGVEFVGEYPLAHLSFIDDAFPVRVSLDAFNPMIPGNVEDSGLPVAIFNWRLENRLKRPIRALLVAVISNLVGFHPPQRRGDPAWDGGLAVNSELQEVSFRGILMGTERHGSRHPHAGTMVLATPWPETALQTGWDQRGYGVSLRPLWYQLLGLAPFEEKTAPLVALPEGDVELHRRPEATLGMSVRLEPGALAKIPVILAWHFPNRYVRDRYVHARRDVVAKLRWVGNYYATRFTDAVSVARYVIAELARLETETREFHRHLYATTLPDPVVDAVTANMSTLRTQTCFRDASGHFYAYEGCGSDFGGCPMNCTHVWMYEQALASLYPTLERDMRENAFLVEIEDDGMMHFRTRTPRGADVFAPEQRPTADGQMAEVVQLLRDYQLCGDREFLARLWPRAKLALEYGRRPGGWDADGDGVMEGEQHNTSDVEYYGPNPFCTLIYLAALRAAAEIGRELGDQCSADMYEALARRGSHRADDIMWNGEYYQQRLELAPSTALTLAMGRQGRPTFANGVPNEQLLDGCHVDQLFGQWLANLCGLSSLLDHDRIRRALKAIYRHNFKRMSQAHMNWLRAFAINDERGLLFVSYPREPGQIAPQGALFRASEVWSGSEYQVACHMIQEGLIAEGQAIVESIRARHDGSTRNPWNEPEAGGHYARAMASYGLLQAYARSHFDLGRGRIALSPQVSRDHFCTFFSVDGAWGSLRLQQDSLTIELGAGELTIRELVLDGRPIPISGQLRVEAGQPLTIRL